MSETARSVGVVLALAVAGLSIAVLGGALGAGSLDAHIASDAHAFASDHSALVHVCRDLTWLGAPIVVDLIVVAGALVCLSLGHRRAALFLVVARVAALLVSMLLKHVVGRDRPHFAHPFLHATGPSFPSGHATGAASTYLAIAVVVFALTRRPTLRWGALATAVVICLVVAATRVLLGVHYMTDVVAGLALGGTVVSLAGRYVYPGKVAIPARRQR